MKRESLNKSIPSPHFQSRRWMLNHTGGTYSHNGMMMDYPRIPKAELNLGKFSESMEFQSWKVNFRTEVCLRTADPHLTSHWIKESWDSNPNWRTYDIAIDCGANRFPRLRYAWCDDCICIEKASQLAGTFQKESKCRRTAWSEIRPILTRETKLLTWSTSFSVQLELMKQYKDSQNCSENVCRMTTSETSTFDRIKLCYQQATCLQMWSWKDCTSQN